MRLLVSAGEASGDRLGAQLISGLRERLPQLQVRGLCGPLMRAAGGQAVARSEELSVMGLVEVLRALPRVLSVRRRMMATLAQGADLLVVIDAPDFNIPLARAARRRGIPVLFYVSPQIWAWRKGRARQIAGLADEVICLLPFEPPLYQAVGGRACFLGSPVAERAPQLPAGGQDWALLPGSRPAELRRQLAPMHAALRLLQDREGGRIRLPLAPGLDPSLVAGLEGVEVVGSLEEALAGARGALVTSGTAVLEVACAGTPQVLCYRAPWLTWWVGRLLVRDIRYLGLPNLILDRPVVPEVLQDLAPARLADTLTASLDAQQSLGVRLRAALRAEGAGARVADRVAEHLETRP